MFWMNILQSFLYLSNFPLLTLILFLETRWRVGFFFSFNSFLRSVFFLFTWPLRWSWEVNLHHISFVWFKVLKFLGWCFQDASWDPFKNQLWKDFLETDIVSNTNDWIVADIILSLITQETTLRLFRERQWWSSVKIKLWL